MKHRSPQSSAVDCAGNVLDIVGRLTNVSIELNEISIAAGHHPDLLEQWLRLAYRIAGLNTLVSAYSDAMDVIRSCPLDQVDATTAWMRDLGKRCRRAQADADAATTRFRHLSDRLAKSGDFVWVNPDQDEPPAEAPEHDCLSAGTLAYCGQYGAPGFGEAWDCTACHRGWARLGDTFYPAEDGAHILTLDDVRKPSHCDSERRDLQ